MNFLNALLKFANHRAQAYENAGIIEPQFNVAVAKIRLECGAFGHLPPHRQYHKVKELAPYARYMLPTNTRFAKQRKQIEQILIHAEAMALPQIFNSNQYKNA